MKKEWVQRDVDRLQIDNLMSAHQVSEHLARVMLGRGLVSVDDVGAYLEPDLAQLSNPFLLRDMQKACERLVDAISRREKIGIFGDYDVDGVCSAAVLWDFLEQCGARVCAKIPNRLVDGYGLNFRLLQEMKEEGVKVVVTVDCGITDHAEIEQAYEMGMEVIVVDHHTVPVTLPMALALINPHHNNCPMQATYLCAAGVVFYLCMALRKILREKNHFIVIKEPNLKDLLDLVALATVADVMSLKNANRVFVKHGLDVLKRSKRPGLRALMDVALVDPERLSASTLGFQLGPRINAAGRLDDAGVALRLLRMTNYEEALSIAKTLNEYNLERREEEKRITAEAVSQIEKSDVLQNALVNVVFDEGWHPGVVGIVASRLVEKFGKPAIVIGAQGKGSGRSIPAFHLHDAVAGFRTILNGFGGHAHAIGLHVDVERIDEFRTKLNIFAQKVLKPEDLVQKLYHDGICEIEDANPELVNELNRAAPFGRSNAEPVFLFKDVLLADLRELRGGHIRGKVRGANGPDFVAFGLKDQFQGATLRADILASIELNHWNQKSTLQLRVRDVQPIGLP